MRVMKDTRTGIARTLDINEKEECTPEQSAKIKKNVGVTRKKADKIIQELLERVKMINAVNDPFVYPFKITRVVLFGSYINTTKDKLGDIDVSVETAQTWIAGQDRDIRSHYAQIMGAHSFFDSITSAERYIRKILRNNSTALSITDKSTLEHLIKQSEKEGTTFEYKEIYSHPFYLNPFESIQKSTKRILDSMRKTNEILKASFQNSQ